MVARENNITILPGFDPKRNSTLAMFSGILLSITSIMHHPTGIPTFILPMTIVMTVSIWACVSWLFWNMIKVLMKRNIDYLKEASDREIFIPHIISDLGLFILFSIICFWTIILGGITASPFVNLLTISPVFFWVRQATRNVNNLYEAIFKKINRPITKECRRYISIISVLRLMPIILVITTLTIGELILHNDFFLLLINLQKECIINIVRNTKWGNTLSYLVFLTALIAAVLSIIDWEKIRLFKSA
ncbi:hypothetical protein ISS30_01335 [bacterium]|nr:hypothetical protein [bacterium]